MMKYYSDTRNDKIFPLATAGMDGVERVQAKSTGEIQIKNDFIHMWATKKQSKLKILFICKV